MQSNMVVDDTDRRIINALLSRGRASIRDIASEIGAAATTVQNRLSKLEDGGIIEGYRPIVAYEALGYDVTAAFHLSVDGDGIRSVIDQLREHDRMVSVYEVTGNHDVVTIGKFTSTEEMNRQIKDLLTDPDVKAANTSVVLNVVTEDRQFEVDLTTET